MESSEVSEDSFNWTSASSTSESEDSEMKAEKNDSTGQEINSDVDYKKNLHHKLFKEPESNEVKVKRELLNAVKREPDSEVENTHKQSTCEGSVKKKSKKRSQIQIKEELKNDTSIESVIKLDIIQNSSIDEHEHKTKKKKSKRKKHISEQSEDAGNMIVEEKLSIEETVVESRPKKRKLSQTNSEDGETQTEHMRKVKRKKANSNEKHNLMSEPTLIEDHSVNCNNYPEPVPHQNSKISDFIQFEEEVDLETGTDVDNPNNISSVSSEVKRYLRKNSDLKALSHITQNVPIISQDDEIWLLNTPTDIEIDLLKDKDFTLDSSKCKLKVNSQTYIGQLEDASNRLPVMLYEHNNAVIKNVLPRGTIILYKRIPKAHVLEDNTMSYNRTDFIPLPQTKCRHPLFGADYKKAMKIHSSVKARLKDAIMKETTPPSDKKKKKKLKAKQKNIPAAGEEDTHGADVRKRKFAPETSPEQARGSKRRRLKQESGVLSTWDSEKAIEENLFNF